MTEHTPPADPVRQAFEKFGREQWLMCGLDFARHEDRGGLYVSPDTHRMWSTWQAALSAPPSLGEARLSLDTEQQVFFYEQDHYYLSNFSAFKLQWAGITFDTSEAAYHWEKFPDHPNIRAGIIGAQSAHDAFKLAEAGKRFRRADWDDVKAAFMLDILRAKADQHEYVRRKLLQTGERELVENSWRDDYWGWGPSRNGRNMLGKLWMVVRSELRAALSAVPTQAQEGK